MDKKGVAIGIIIAVVLISGALVYTGRRKAAADNAVPPVAALVTGDTQVIDITARGGYSPRVVTAKRGVPTTLRVTTNNSYDCSIALTIPKLRYQKFLKSTGVEEIVIPADKAEGTLRGLCQMGMYSFEIRFL